MGDDKTTATPAGDAAPAVGDKAGNVDLDATAAKYRRESEAGIAKADKKTATEKGRADKLQAQLDEIAEANKTEQEKAIGAARKEGEATRDAFWNAKVTGMAVDHALRDDLRTRGYDPDFAMLVKAGGDVESADSAGAAVKGWLETKGWPEKATSGGSVPGYQGSPDPARKKDSDVWNAERVRNATAEEINANWDKIKAQNPSGNFK